jgi:zinc protease
VIIAPKQFGFGWLYLCLSLTQLGAQVRTAPKPVRAAKAPLPFAEFIKSYDETPFVTKAVFKNGLTVLVHEFHVAPVASVMTWVKSGDLDEPAGKSGAARLLAQLLYRGTPTRGPGVIGQDVRALGGEWTASAELDHFSVRIVGPAAQWKRMLEILSDASLNPALEASGIRPEVDRLRTLDAEELDDPMILLSRRLKAASLGRAGLLPAGPEELQPLAEINREALQDYFHSVFQPSQTILVAAGDVTSTEVLNEVARLYGKVPLSAARTPSRSFGTVQSGLRYAEVFGSVKLPRIGLSFPAPALGAPDYPAVEVLRHLIAGGEASIVNRRLKHEKKVVLSGSADYLALAGAGWLEVRLQTAPEDVDRAEIGLISQLELLRREDPDDVDAARAVAQAETAHWESLETVEGRSRMLALYESLGDWKRMNPVVDQLRKVTPAEIRRVASKYLALEKATVVELLPTGTASRNLTAETAYRTLHDLLDPAVEQIAAEREKEVVTAVEIPAEAGTYKFSEVRYPIQRATVLRGPELFIREDHSSPLIHLGVFVPGGRLSEKKDNAGITMLTLQSIFRGTKERPAEQFWRQLEVCGGRLEAVAAEDYFGVFLTILSRNVEAGLNLLLDTVRNPNFDKDEIERLRNIQLAQAASLGETAGAQMDALLSRGLLGDHPYGLAPFGTSQSLGTLDAEAVRSWYRTTVRNFKPIVVILGDTQGTSLAQFFVKSFSGTRIQDVKLPDNPVKPGSAKVSSTEKSDHAFGLVSLAYPAPPDGDDDVFVLTLVRSLLGGRGGRLWDQLVEKRRLASEVAVEYRHNLRGGELEVRAITAPGSEEKALKALEEETQQFLTSTLLFRDYRSALNLAIGEYTVARQNRRAVIADLVASVLTGRTLEGYLEHTTRLQEVAQDDLQEVGSRFMKPPRSVTVELRSSSTP